MKVKDYVSIIKGDVSINITYADKKITEFKAPYWDTIEEDILDLEIRSVAFPGKSVIIETKTGRPVIVSTPAELDAAVADENIRFIKLGDDIAEAVTLESGQKILDLAGHVLTAPANVDVINVSGDALLDVFDSDCGGLVSCGGNQSTVKAEDNATIRLHGGDYVGGDNDEDGSTIIYAAGASVICIYDGYYVNLTIESEGATILKSDFGAGIACFGGRFKAEDPSEYVADGYYSAAIPDTDPVVYEVKSIL